MQEAKKESCDTRSSTQSYFGHKQNNEYLRYGSLDIVNVNIDKISKPRKNSVERSLVFENLEIHASILL